MLQQLMSFFKVSGGTSAARHAASHSSSVAKPANPVKQPVAKFASVRHDESEFVKF